ncbi:MAG: TonB-dependent receptor [Myxococcota bacterium]
MRAFATGALLVCAAPDLVHAADEGCTSVLSGRVIDVQTLDAVVGASVSVRTDRDREAKTGADGNYLLQDLCPGTAQVEVRRSGYQTHTESFGLNDGPNRHDYYLLTGSVDRVRVDGESLSEEERSARATSLLGEDELRSQRGRDLARTLEQLPGIRALGTGAVSKPIINGLTADRLLILQEGVRLESQDWGLDHAPEVDVYGAERVVVTKGAATVRYGPKAIGGVISLEPAPYPDAPGRIEGEGTGVAIANGRGGSANASVRARLSKAWAARAQASYRRTGSLDSPRYVLDNTGQEEFGFTGGVAWMPGRAKIELSVRGYQTTYGLFTRIRDESLDSFLDAQRLELPRLVDTFRFDYDFDRPNINSEHYQVRLGAEVPLGPRTSLDAFYAFQTDDRREFDTVRGSLEDFAQGAFRLDTHSLSASLEHQTGDFTLEPGILLEAQENAYEGFPFIPDYTRLGIGSFFIGRWVKARWEAEAGVRVDFQAYDNTIAPRGEAPGRDESLDYLSVTGSMGAVYDLGNDWSLRGQVATASRNPSPPELFADGPSVGVAGLQIGDPSLDIEYTLNVQSTLGVSKPRFHFQLTGYVQNFFNYVYLAPNIDEDGVPVTEATVVGELPTFNYRQTDARFWGFDGVLHAELPKLSFDTQASIVRARDLGEDRFLVFVPADRVSQRLTFELPSGPKVHDTYIYAEGTLTLRQTRFDIAADFTPPPQQYVLLNAGLGGTFDIGDQELIVSLEVQNATNALYRDYLSRLRYYADEPGVQAFLRMTIPFTLETGKQQKEQRTR